MFYDESYAIPREANQQKPQHNMLEVNKKPKFLDAQEVMLK